MAATKANAHAHDDEVASGSTGASGVREAGAHGERERETTPAPPQSADDWATNIVASARPTSVPEFDLAALAFESSLRHQPHPALPLDMTVPSRTRVEVPAQLELRAAFLLLHVDGRSSLRDIAELTALPLDEVVATFRTLAREGFVELAGVPAARRAVPISGEREKVVVPNDDTPRRLDDIASLDDDDDTLR